MFGPRALPLLLMTVLLAACSGTGGGHPSPSFAGGPVIDPAGGAGASPSASDPQTGQALDVCALIDASATGQALIPPTTLITEPDSGPAYDGICLVRSIVERRTLFSVSVVIDTAEHTAAAALDAARAQAGEAISKLPPEAMHGAKAYQVSSQLVFGLAESTFVQIEGRSREINVDLAARLGEIFAALTLED